MWTESYFTQTVGNGGEIGIFGEREMGNVCRMKSKSKTIAALQFIQLKEFNDSHSMLLLCLDFCSFPNKHIFDGWTCACVCESYRTNICPSENIENEFEFFGNANRCTTSNSISTKNPEFHLGERKERKKSFVLRVRPFYLFPVLIPMHNIFPLAFLFPFVCFIRSPPVW